MSQQRTYEQGLKKSLTKIGESYAIEDLGLEVFENEFGVILVWVSAHILAMWGENFVNLYLQAHYGLVAKKWDADPWSYRFYAICEWA